jgi:hypothetical protein
MACAADSPKQLTNPAVKKGQQCPECGDPSSFRIIYSRMIRGQRRRRRHCKSCGFLTVDLDGEPIQAPGRAGWTRRFTREQIAQIVMLKGHQTQRLTAQQFGCSGEMVRQIWAGRAYSDWTGISYRQPLRPGEPSCERCREWRGPDAEHPCRMGFPDPVIEGPGFARDCSLFQEA